MADIKKMLEEIKGMTVVELNDLVHAIEEEFGVSAAAMAVLLLVALLLQLKKRKLSLT